MRILIIYPGATWSPYDVATGYEWALKELGHEVRAFQYDMEYRYQVNFLNHVAATTGRQFPPGAPGLECDYCMYWWADGITAELPEQ